MLIMNGNNIIFFDKFWYFELNIPKGIKKFIRNKNVITNSYRM